MVHTVETFLPIPHQQCEPESGRADRSTPLSMASQRTDGQTIHPDLNGNTKHQWVPYKSTQDRSLQTRADLRSSKAVPGRVADESTRLSMVKTREQTGRPTPPRMSTLWMRVQHTDPVASNFLPSAPHHCSSDPDHLPAWGSALPILRDPEGNFTGRRDNSDLRGLVDRGRTAGGEGIWLPWLNTRGSGRRVLSWYQLVRMTLKLGV